MLRDMVRRPLEQLLALLWLVGMANLTGRLLEAQLSVGMVFTALLAGMLAVYLIVHYRLPGLSFLPVLCGLAAVLVLLKSFGVGQAGLMLAQAVYALASWRFWGYAEGRGWLKKALDLLNIKSENAPDFDSAKLLAVSHLTSLLMLAVSVGLQLTGSALLTGQGGHSATLLLTLLCAMVFFWFGGRIGKPVLQSYLVIGFALLAVTEATSLSLHPFSFAAFGSDVQIGLFLVSLSIVLCALASVLSPDTGGCGSETCSGRGIYARSLRTTATLLAVTSFWLQSLQLIVLSGLVIRPPDVLIPALAAIALLWANRLSRFPGIDLLPFLFAIQSLLALDYLILHFGQPYDLRPGEGFPDQWLLLGSISLLLASIPYRLKAHDRAEHYTRALNAAAATAYTGAMLAAIFSFGAAPFEKGLFHLGISLILIVGQFLLLRGWRYADRMRGITVPLLLLAALCAMLSVIQRTDLLRLGIAVYAFGLLLWAQRLLPFINDRWPGLAVYPAFPAWIGLILVYACLLAGGPVWILEWPWLLAAAFYQLLLRKSWLDLPAFLMWALAALWAASAWLHPGAGFNLWPGMQWFPDIWFCLALASFVYAVLSKWTPGFPAAAALYRKPLRNAGALCGTWALLGALPLLSSLGSAGSEIFPWHYLTLFLALFPLSENRDNGILIRDIGGSILFALTFLSAWELNPHFPPLWIGSLTLGFLLWMTASWIVPAFSRRFPAWGFKPVCWPWLGLLGVFAAFPVEPRAFNLTVYFLALSAYGVLMLRYSRLSVFTWLPGASFTLAGLAAGALSENLFWIFSQKPAFASVAAFYTGDIFPLAFTVNTLAWANFQWLIVKIGRQRGVWFARKLQLQRQDVVAKTFESGALLIINGGLLLYAVRILAAFWHGPHAASMALPPGSLLVGLLLMLSCLHALLSQVSGFRLHGLLSALLLTLADAYLTSGSNSIPLPMGLALWCLLLAVVEALCTLYHGESQQPIGKALAVWTRLSLALATLSLLLHPFETLGGMLSSLLSITLITAFQGLWMRRASWFYMACVELLAVLHLWPFLLLDAAQAVALLPWYALQLYLLAGLISLGSLCLEERRTDINDRLSMCRLVISLQSLLNALAFVELIAHGIAAVYRLQQGQEVLWLSPFWDPLAALAAGMIQCIIGMRQARKAPDSAPVYGIVLLIAALGGYLRLILVGVAPVSFWDTSVLIVFAYGLFFIQRIFPSRPLLRMAMLMPLAALITVPMQLKSPEASATLMMTGLLYLLIRRYTHQRLPLYLALLAFNVGLYLWIPGIVKQSHLVQIYVIPAALSLLILLQLHRRELKPSVMMSTRLAATSSIYACATLDVFLLPDLNVFVLALGLSLAGVVLGIALRIRAFLYAGIAFMLLNVFGQLIRFYPDQALGKAVVLMGAGMMILGAMIWFNLKKMQIMQRFDLIRVELEAWD
ncbi:MAG: hypothetical protein ACR65O_02515 [Methylomicrobium sp.]